MTSSWLNRTRLRRQALLLSLALWLGYGASIATPGMRDRFGHLKGADFLHGYVLGTIALEHRGDLLYDASAQRAIGERRVPASAGDYFLPVYGPQYSLLWMPLALLPYAWAAAIWLALSAAIYAACCYAVWRTCPNLRAYSGTVALAAAAFPGFFGLITFGQNSALALTCFTAAYFALRARREFLAGLCLGLLAFKPQLAIVCAFAFGAQCLWFRRTSFKARSFGVAQRFSAADRPSLRGAASAAEGNYSSRANFSAARHDSQLETSSRRQPARILIGAALAIFAQFALAWAWYGKAPLFTYGRVLKTIGSAAHTLEPRPYLMHSLRAFWNLLLPWPTATLTLYALTALATIALAIVTWQQPRLLEHRYAVMLMATVLVAPHLTVYDLVILAPAFLWVADFSITDPLQTHAARRLGWLLYLAYLLPFTGPLARWTHLQLSVPCFAALALLFGRRLATPAQTSDVN